MLALYLPFMPILIGCVISIIHFLWPSYKSFWLVSVISATIIWVITIILQIFIPSETTLFSWTSISGLKYSPNLILDDISWSYSFAIATLFLSSFLVSVSGSRQSFQMQNRSSWIFWVFHFLILGLGLLSILAGNLLTLIISWITIDLCELIVTIYYNQDDELTRKALGAFFLRIFSIIIITWVISISKSANLPLEWASITAQTSVFLLISVGLRLISLLVQPSYFRNKNYVNSLTMLLRFIPTASILLVLARLNFEGVSRQLILFTLTMSGLAAMLIAFFWVSTQNMEIKITYWSISVTGFCIAASAQGITTASMAWGIGLLLSGGLFFLYFPREHRYSYLPIIGLFGFSALPMTPSWYGIQIYSQKMPHSLWIIFLVAQIFLLFGYIETGKKDTQVSSNRTRILLITFIGSLIFLPITQYIIMIFSAISSGSLEDAPLSIPANISTISAFIIAIFMFFIREKWYSGFSSFVKSTKSNSSLALLFQIANRIFLILKQVIFLFNQLIEGRGAFLWALLFMTILIMILTQIGIGE